LDRFGLQAERLRIYVTGITVLDPIYVLSASGQIITTTCLEGGRCPKCGHVAIAKSDKQAKSGQYKIIQAHLASLGTGENAKMPQIPCEMSYLQICEIL
jgi:hypothetical protein